MIDHQFAMNCFEPLFWGGLAFVVLRLINTGNPKLWLLFGAIAGVGLQTKYSIIIFGAVLLAGLLLTHQRRLLFTPWILAGGAIAFLIFLPNLIWNIQNNWPFLELMHNVRATGKDVVLPPGEAAEFSTWTIICEEVLDTQFARVYFERAREELHRRGITDAEIAEMRRFAWLTAGWLNFERGLWEWCNLDEQDIYRAIEWQYSDGYISADERDRRMEYAKRYDRAA